MQLRNVYDSLLNNALVKDSETILNKKKNLLRKYDTYNDDFLRPCVYTLHVAFKKFSDLRFLDQFDLCGVWCFEPVTVSMVKVWNYSKTPIRGVQQFGVRLIITLLEYEYHSNYTIGRYKAVMVSHLFSLVANLPSGIFQAPAVRWYALPRNDSNGEMHSLSCICSEILTKEEYWHKFGHLYQLWIFQGSEGRGRAWESQEFPFSYFKIRKCMNETWVIESHGNGIKCWEKGTKYRVMEVIKNATGQVIEFYKLRRIWIPRFCTHCFSFGKYYSPGRTWLGILKSLSYLLDLNLFLLLFC